jgi:hypothetical protein
MIEKYLTRKITRPDLEKHIIETNLIKWQEKLTYLKASTG